MTAEGRLSRGKENLLRGRFLLNSETIAVPKEVEKKVEVKEEKKIVKEKKDAK